jgi:hypothetical protein
MSRYLAPKVNVALFNTFSHAFFFFKGRMALFSFVACQVFLDVSWIKRKFRRILSERINRDTWTQTYFSNGEDVSANLLNRTNLFLFWEMPSRGIRIMYLRIILIFIFKKIWKLILVKLVLKIIEGVLFFKAGRSGTAKCISIVFR